MARCRCAPALDVLLDQINGEYPKRDKASDGCCGDAAHAARKSDHNPDKSGYAHARDIDEDVRPGANLGSQPLLPWVPVLLSDERAKYVIYEGRIWYASCNTHGSECWAKGGHVYNGANAHEKHLHLSIRSGATYVLDPWPELPHLRPVPIPSPPEEGDDVREIQTLIRFDDGDPAFYWTDGQTMRWCRTADEPAVVCDMGHADQRTLSEATVTAAAMRDRLVLVGDPPS